MIAKLKSSNPALEEWTWAIEACRAPRLRSMREFAEQEIIIPDGPYKDLKFNCDRQPFVSLWFAALEMSCWRRRFAVGPVQTGKTLICFVIPILWHLFENGWEDKEFIRQRVYGMDEIRAEVKKWTPEEVRSVTGVPESQMRRVARTLADLDGADIVARIHIAEALSYRGETLKRQIAA